MLQNYAGTSDLDTGVAVESDGDVAGVVDAVKDEIDGMRPRVAGQLGAIVAACNRAAMRFVFPGVVRVEFFEDAQADQSVDVVAAGGHCPYPECTRVRTSAAAFPVFVSDNASLCFSKGHNLADFHLIRAKWAIRARVHRAGGACETTCPAELIDVAIPRRQDSRKALAAIMNTDAYHRAYRVAPAVTVPMVSLKYQLIDLRQMLEEARRGGSDPKLAKRAHRFIVLSAIHHVLRAARDDDDDYDAFARATDWRALTTLPTADAPTLALLDFIEASVPIDVVLVQYLMAVRDVVLSQSRAAAWTDFTGVGKQAAGAGHRALTAGSQALALAVLAVAVFS